MIMDRLPLVQAPTAAGIERAGADGVVTALSDAIVASVATKADIAGLKGDIARVEAAAKADFAGVTADIARLEAFTRAEFARSETSRRAEMGALEMRLTLRLGGVVVTAMSVLFVLLRFTGHAP